MSAPANPILSVRNLSVSFGEEAARVPVVSAVSFDIGPGMVLGIAGESGSGKTTACLATIGYYRPGSGLSVTGEVLLAGESLLRLDPPALRRMWARKVSYVAQDAARALNPARRIDAQLAEILTVNLRLGRVEARDRTLELLESVRLQQPALALQKYPHEFSGGQLQRIAVAMAIACDPRLIVFDEPTTGLDVTTQAEVIDMLSALIRQRRIACIYVSHDIGVLRMISDELAIMYAGQIVERGPTKMVVSRPRHPYVRALLDSLLTVKASRRPMILSGLPPGRVLENTCAFATRCRFVEKACLAATPPLLTSSEGTHEVRCRRSPELGILRSAAGVSDDGPPGGSLAETPLLKIENLICEYGERHRRWRAVDDVSLEIHAGEVVALVGESGSGKSTIARAVAGILAPRAGNIAVDGSPLAPLADGRSPDDLRDIQIIFQNPDSSLNPRHTIRTLIARAIALFRPDVRRPDYATVVAQMLQEVLLDPALAGRYPHSLSGGQRQRVAIARAFVAQPRLVICDEIVSGQDVSVQAAILELLRSMQRVHRTALLFISHDLAVVRSIAQRVYVMEKGKIKEAGFVSDVLNAPHDLYTQRLLDATLRFEDEVATASPAHRDSSVQWPPAVPDEEKHPHVRWETFAKARPPSRSDRSSQG